MRNVLVTGASGFIGKEVAPTLAEKYRVVCIGRRDPGLDLPWIQGAFHSPEDLRKLDEMPLDIVVHLAAETGKCSEREGFLVNVEGTRRLMRPFLERGCKKFVIASSIAAVGTQDPAFRPVQLPIQEDHPCLCTDAYGFSKFLMEEMTGYLYRQSSEIDVLHLRLGTVRAEGHLPPLREAKAEGTWTLGAITLLGLQDAVRAFQTAVDAPYRAGVRILNVCDTRSWVRDPMPEVLKAWYGDDVDCSYYEREGREWDSAFSVTRLQEELGFTPRGLHREER